MDEKSRELLGVILMEAPARGLQGMRMPGVGIQPSAPAACQAPHTHPAISELARPEPCSLQIALA